MRKVESVGSAGDRTLSAMLTEGLERVGEGVAVWESYMALVLMGNVMVKRLARRAVSAPAMVRPWPWPSSIDARVYMAGLGVAVYKRGADATESLESRLVDFDAEDDGIGAGAGADADADVDADVDAIVMSMASWVLLLSLSSRLAEAVAMLRSGMVESSIIVPRSGARTVSAFPASRHVVSAWRACY